MIFRRRDDEGFESSSWWGILTHPFRVLGHAISDLLKGDDRIDMDQSIGSRIVGLLTLPFRLLGGFFVFMIQAWTSSRPGFAFIRAIPAIVVLAGFFGCLLVADLFYSEARLIGICQNYLRFQQQTSPEHPEYAHIFAERLVELTPENPKSKYELGLSYDRMGDRTKAYSLMSMVAPFDNTGDPRAHIWLARYFAKQIKEAEQKEQVDQEKFAQTDELILRHLLFAVESDPENQMAHVNLASLYLEKSRTFEKGTPEYGVHIDSAIKHLQIVASSGRITGFQLNSIPRLAELRLERDDPADVREWLGGQVIRFKAVARKNPDVFELWFVLVRCAVLSKEYQQALDIVKEGLQLAGEKEVKDRIRKLASQIFLQKSEDFKDMRSEQQYRFRLHALSEAIQFNPTDKVVYLKLLDFIGDAPANTPIPEGTGIQRVINRVINERLDFSQASEEWLDDALGNSPGPGVVHALIGMREISKGNVTDGEQHWRIAEQQYSATQIIVNNLIDVAAKERPSEFANMQDMITLGIELFPNQPIFYQTRGVFLKNHGKPQDAIVDLVHALEKMPNMVSLHTHLISCYEQTGNQAKVLEHKSLLEEKLNELDEAERKLLELSLERID